MLNYRPNIGQIKLRQALMEPDKTRILCYSGARAGKTFEFLRAIIVRALMAPRSRHAIIRKHFATAKKFIWLDTLPEVMQVCFPQIAGRYEINKSDYFYRLHNDSEIWLGGLDDKDRADRILGGEYNTIFFNECSEVSWHSVSTALTRLAKRSEKVIEDPITGKEVNCGLLINKALFDTNPPAKSHWSYKLFFEAIDPETRIQVAYPEQFARVHISPDDNAENLSDDFLLQLRSLTGAKRQRFYEGVYQDDIQGALWTDTMINRARREAPSDLNRIVVAIDPATTTTQDSDETGIIVVGRCDDGHFYLLDDLSGFYTPNTWAEKALGAYKTWNADRIVGESNNGGDMIETIIRNIQPNVSYSKVWASRGKVTRAEPVAALYETEKVHHIRQFTDLEYEMTTYTGAPGENSPNRLDALVWAISSLMDSTTKGLNLEELTKIFF